MGVDITATVVKETEKAVRIKHESQTEWVPKAAIESQVPEVGERASITVKDWVYSEKFAPLRVACTLKRNLDKAVVIRTQGVERVVAKSVIISGLDKLIKKKKATISIPKWVRESWIREDEEEEFNQYDDDGDDDEIPF